MMQKGSWQVVACTSLPNPGVAGCPADIGRVKEALDFPALLNELDAGSEVTAFSDRLRQPDNLSTTWPSRKTLFLPGETHGFAPLPRGRFALIVCNHRFAKDHRRLLGQRTNLIKQYLTMPVKK
jgi:hypothetical protein